MIISVELRSRVFWIPFSNQINSAFESRRGFAWKVTWGSFVGLVIGITFCFNWGQRNFDNTPWAFYFVTIGISVALAISLVFVLWLKDAVCTRIAEEKHVNVLLRLLLGYGMASLSIWIVIAVFATFIITIVSSV